MHCRASNIHLSTRKIKLHAMKILLLEKWLNVVSHVLQHGCIILVTLSRDLFKMYNPFVSVQGQNKEQWPSRLSIRSVQSKIYDLLVSVQGQNEEQRPSRLSTRSVQSKIYDPLVLVQGQNEEKWPSRLSTSSVQIQNLQPFCLITRLV